ncbi:carboxylesterase family protein-like protein [Elsinoe ampelina]|uniref:Carboxylic ester hydrolase n=1 Tax=Elsinoe ampelina TaxID=302913 RepID=A0A6A6G0M1_9PEZI|nr:carboxylesterase family protein-like protein [Elsinoe ampelina]
MKSVSVLAALGGLAAAQQYGNAPRPNNTALPIVDLGYELQQASGFNDTGRYYNFSNIRYAAPPVGNLRFAEPAAPARNRGSVQTGQQNRICPQAAGAWSAIAGQFIPRYLAGQTTFNASSFVTPPAGTIPAQDPATNEDCLFLDVFVPDTIFNQRKQRKKAPVLVWIYGGGYTGGSKSGSGSPAGLLDRSRNNGQDGIIYVALNYRLGAFGWLSGPTFQENGGVANAALYDQRFALQWVTKYIHLFGGDPDQVTVFGESAGGGSIMHQITAFGGTKGKAPFQRAVPQSPGWAPITSPQVQEDIFNEFLANGNFSSLAEARAAPFAQVQLANLITVGGSSYGSFTFGPVVDGIFAPSLPGQLLARGQFDRDVSILVGQNTNEGLLFTSPFIQTEQNLRDSLVVSQPQLAAFPDQIDFILNDLYPPIFDGSQAQGYRNQIARSAAITAELAFICNTFYLDKAYGNKTYSYLFAVPPALHGQDVPYSYYTGTGAPTTSVIAPPVALALQEYITSFAQDGDPNEPGVPFFDLYGPDASVKVLNITGFSETRDPAANRRCNYWQKALYS